MTNSYCVEPEVAGQAVIKRDGSDGSVELHYEFIGWLGDELLGSGLKYIVTNKLLRELRENSLTGYKIGSAVITKSTKFERRHPNKTLPEFHWLRVEGTPGVDDFGIGEQCLEEDDSCAEVLVVSENTLNVLRNRQLAYAKIELYEPNE